MKDTWAGWAATVGGTRILWLLLLTGCPTPNRPAADAGQVAAVLDDWHRAASAADTERYFGHFTADAIFIGTDASERWTVEQFRAYARPHFDAGKGWCAYRQT